MAIDFSFLEGADSQKENTPAKSDTATVTIRVDADSLLLCDGEYIDHPFKAGVITKIQLPIGHHLLEFLYMEDPDIKIEKEVDFLESGKSYLVLIKGLKDLIDAAAEEAEEEEKRLEELKTYINGHKFVDLGLPSGLKWAACNVGASSPEENGDYYAWGELEAKRSYTEKNCVTYRKWMFDISGNPTYDVARKKWGSSWRMPSKDEFQELIDMCEWQQTTYGGKNGCKVTGPNGNSIFLPAAGYRDESSYKYVDTKIKIWSSSDGAFCWAYYLSKLQDSSAKVTDAQRLVGFSVRPVSD